MVIYAATSDHCVETTTRKAGNLGFDARFVCDATSTFDWRGPDRLLHRAEDIWAMTKTNRSVEFAEIVRSRDALQALGESTI